MTILLYACWREPGDALDAETLVRAADRIAPSGVRRHPHHVVVDRGDCLCLTGPVGAAVAEGTSAHLGAFEGSWPLWHLPGSPQPDGTYALVRSDPARTELCSDFAGSRTLWYAQTDRQFFASTSQRALICLLKSFQLNRTAVAWFLSSGSLGPSDAWDPRLSRLPRGARLELDRIRWRTELHTVPADFHPRPMRAAPCARELEERLQDAVQGFDFSSGTWTLPLSGGYDCRFLLSALYQKGLRPQTLTWGLAASLTQPGNDAFIARRLAGHYGLAHDYLLTERSPDPPAQVVDAFLGASGGTTDQLFPYMDGLRLWSSFPERGFDGVIRGDEGFGWIPVRTQAHARTSVGLMVLTDFLDPATAEQIAEGPQRIPQELEWRPDETIPAYRDRLYHGFRIPVGLAALNDVKAPFVEIASPLLSRRVLEFVREMPDGFRTGKGMFKTIARAASPAIPYATLAADDSRNGFLGSAAYGGWLEQELGGEFAEGLFPPRFLQSLRAGVHRGPSATGRSLRATLKRVIPASWVQAVRGRMGPILPEPSLLSLRAALICRMVRLLEEDSRYLR